MEKTTEASERISQRPQGLNEAFLGWEANARQATEAFQGLQEASKDLVDLEIVIPAGHTTGPESLEPLPSTYSIERILQPPQLYRITPAMEDDISKALSNLFPEPWYKRLWSACFGDKFTGLDRLTSFYPIPFTAEQVPILPEHVAIVDKPLTDSEFQEVMEQLDRVLRLPWYKRAPALILWLWRLP